MPAKKKTTILYSSRIQFAPSGEDKMGLHLIEAKLANDYGRTRLEITDAECLRYAIRETVGRWTDDIREGIDKFYMARTSKKSFTRRARG